MRAPARALHRDAGHSRKVRTAAALLETMALKAEGHLCPLMLSRVAVWVGSRAALDSGSALGNLDFGKASEGKQPLFIPGVPGRMETGWPALDGRAAGSSICVLR